MEKPRAVFLRRRRGDAPHPDRKRPQAPRPPSRGEFEKVSASATGFDVPAPADDRELLLLNDALDAFARHDPPKAGLVKQWYFVGLTLAEIAEVRGVSERTAKRDLAYARAWLFSEIKRQRGEA